MVVDDALLTMINNMPEKTGKSLEEWSKILNEQQFDKHSEALNFLKKEHGVSHGYANTIVHLFKNDENETGDDLIKNQYEGKEHLKPIYDSLIKNIRTFGNDIEEAPKKAYVSLRKKNSLPF